MAIPHMIVQALDPSRRLRLGADLNRVERKYRIAIGQAINSLTMLPWTSVRRKSRPAKRYVSLL